MKIDKGDGKIMSGKISKDKSEFLIEKIEYPEIIKAEPKRFYKVLKDGEVILLTEEYEVARKMVFGD